MLFMIIETFKDRDGEAIYQRFAEKGRGAPEGLTYHGSWIEADFNRCFQLMETDDVALIQQWVLNWRDLVEFEIIPVLPSTEVRDWINPLLEAKAAQRDP
jgi:hypothetical protein